MLPRHLLAHAGRLRPKNNLLISLNIVPRPVLSRQPLLASYLHSSPTRRQNEPLKSPFQTFVDVLKEELQKSRELQDSVKQLQGDVDKLQDSEALKRAREMYERARVCLSFFFSFTINR